MDDPYDSIDEYDEQCFKGAADRAALLQMSDLDREMLLAERYERRQLRKVCTCYRVRHRRRARTTTAPMSKVVAVVVVMVVVVVVVVVVRRNELNCNGQTIKTQRIKPQRIK